MSVKLAEMQTRSARDDSSESPRGRGTQGALGLSVQPGDDGVEVTQVDPSGPAADAGIRTGDVLEEINGTPVKSSADVRAAVAKSQGKPALVLVRRGDQTIYVAIPARNA
ncbi:MAG: PDZ domain-containing protein [Bradyrhizobium sp.]|nr:PDZ domain-containing protein [Bradyrhizobium sp.]